MRDSVKGSLMVAVATLGWSLSGMFVRALPRLDSWTINAFRGINMALVLKNADKTALKAVLLPAV